MQSGVYSAMRRIIPWLATGLVTAAALAVVLAFYFAITLTLQR